MVTCKLIKEYLIVNANEPISKIIPKLKSDKQVVVFDNDKYLGIVTRKNVLKEGISLPEEKISNLVFKPPAVYDDTSDLDLAKYFIETGAHFLPVLNKQDKNKIDCVVYRLDFLSEVVTTHFKNIKISEIANTNVKTIEPNDTLAKALSLFHDYGISKLIVYDEGLQGVITLSNILNYFVHSTQISRSVLQNTCVKDVMKTDVISLDKESKVNDAIKLFSEKNISSIVVLESGKLFGILTKSDLLEQFVYESELELKSNSVQISSKFSEINRQEIEEKLLQLEKFSDNCKIFAYFKQGKEKFKGMPLISCRVKVVCPKHLYSVNVDGWGVEHATELAVHKLKRQMGDIRF